MTERTFLQKLADDQQARRTPVVDESFIQTFSQLSWTEQCTAMNHIFFLKNNAGSTVRDHQEVVYRARLDKLYENWLEDQTETWVGIHYRPPIETAYWKGVEPEELPLVQGQPYDEGKDRKQEQVWEDDPFLPSTWKYQEAIRQEGVGA